MKDDGIKKVKAEVVDVRRKNRRFLDSIRKVIFRLKLGIAILLDLVDFVLANIPVLNTLWDFVTFLFLLLTVSNKQLAFFSLGELVLPGIPALGLVDGLIPAATIITIVDYYLSKSEK